jgi:Putative zinc-finger
MRCEEYLMLVEDYFDGETDERTTDLVREHSSACDSCKVAYRKLEREQELYRVYECDARPPAPDFWNDVMAKALGESEATTARAHPLHGWRRWLSSTFGSFNVPRFSPSLTAVIVLAAIGMTVGLMRYFNSREKRLGEVASSQNTNIPATTAPTETPVEIVKSEQTPAKENIEKGSDKGATAQPQLAKNISGRGITTLAANKGRAERGNRTLAKSGQTLTPDELVRQAEQKYVAAITLLSRDVRSRRSQLDAESAARFERTLAAIDRTIADTRRAARQHPGDPVAAQYMLTAYAKKVDVLREMIGY